MSLFKSIGKAIGSVARAASPFTSLIPGLGTVTGVLGMLGQRSKVQAAPVTASGPIVPPYAQSIMSGATGAAMSLPVIGPALSGIARVLPGAGAVVGAGATVVRGAGAAMRAANAWCGRNPAWCVSIGGLPAVLSMVQSGQLPMVKRRRGRGLTARDLRSFRRTVKVIRAVSSSVGLQGRGRARRGSASGGHTIVQN